MTWVVGASTLFGYGIVISDVRVTCLNSGRTIDMLQKAFPVGKFIVAGFAGDVRAGLALLENLYSFLNSVEVVEDELCDPQWVVDNWPTEARKIYQNLGEVGDTHILMLGLKSKKQALGGAIGHLSVFRSPQFMPETQIGGQKTMSIGCGAEVDEYTTILKEIMLGPYLNYMRGELFNIGGYGNRIADVLNWMAKENPASGISRHFQLFIISMGQIVQWNPQDLPRLAQSWDELTIMLDQDIEPQLLVASS